MVTLERMQELVTVGDAAKKRGVSTQRILQLIHAKRLKAKMIAGRYFIESDSLRNHQPLRPWAGKKADMEGSR